MKLIGPFSQIITLEKIPLKGAVSDTDLGIIESGGCLIKNGIIQKVDSFEKLRKEFPDIIVEVISTESVLLPGFVDCHTHTCFAGSRAMDFAERNAGTNYLEIAKKGGGIWSTVLQTRNTDDETLRILTENRVNEFLKSGVTTIEIKSGYGLSVDEELSILKIISSLKTNTTVISTCLASHVIPKDFDGTAKNYLDYLSKKLFPLIKKYTNRIDIFTEKSAFSVEDSEAYLTEAKKQGFQITVHADQFSSGASEMAVRLKASSADHLEASSENAINILANSDTVSVALPGASLGLGEPFAKARKLLDAGACLAIASDFNPGSAPMGDLLTQASILACYQKLTTAEVFSALSFRAAKALDLDHLGKIKMNYVADLQSYPTNDYREILYHQGKLKPNMVWKNGIFQNASFK